MFNAETVTDGLNVNLKMTPKPTGQLADLLRGIGLRAEDPLIVTGQLPTNVFGAKPADVISKINLAATLPKLSFSKVGTIAVNFPKPATLALVGSEAGLTSHIETALKITLPPLDRSFSGEGKFTTKPADGGGRLLQFSGKTKDSGGKPAIIEASLKLPGSPKGFTVKFAGEQTLSSLLGTKIPVIGDLGIQELEKGEDFLVGKIGLKGAQTTVGAFRLNGRWAVAVSASGIKPAEIIPGLDNLPVKDLVLPSAMFVYVSKEPSEKSKGVSLPFDVATLPKQIRTALSGLLKPFGKASSLQPGLNLKSLLDVAKIPNLARVMSFTGNKNSKPLSITGLLPIESFSALTGGGSKFSAKGKDALGKLIAKVDLSTELPAVNLPGVRDVVRFDKPLLRIKGDGTGDKVKLAMKIKGPMEVRLPGVASLNLVGDLAVVAHSDGVALELVGTGSPKDKNVRIEGKVALEKANPRLQLTFTTAVTVADLIGADLPDLADLAMTDVRIGSEVISGAIQYRGATTTLAALDYKLSALGYEKDEKPFIALVPEAVDIANFIPGIAGSPIDNAKLTRAVLMYVPKGKTAYPQNDNYSPAVTAALKLVSKDYSLNPSKGLKAAFDLELKQSGPLAQALQFVGYKKTSMILRGQLPDLMLKRSGGAGSFNVNARAPNVAVKIPKRSRSSGGSGFSGAVLDNLIRGVDLEAEVPALNLPGVNKILHLGDPTFRVKGGAELDGAGRPTDKVKLQVGVSGDLVLKIPGRELTFDGGFNIEKTRGGKAFKLALYSTTQLSWKKAFSLPFLDLNELGLAGSIERRADGRGQLSAMLNSKIKLSAQEFDSTAIIKIASSGLPEVRFNINNKIDVGNLPGLKGVKGLNEVAFSNLWIGTAGLGGRAEIKKLGIGGEANLFFQNAKPVLLLKADQLSLRDLLPKVSLPRMFEDLASIKFPGSVFAISGADLRKVTLSSLPEGVQPMLASLVGGPSDTVPIGDGISLLTTLSKDDLSPNLKTLVGKRLKIFDSNGKGGVSGPLLLSGSLEGLFSGGLKAKLAVKLPDVKLPEQPWAKLINFDSGGAEAVMDIDVPNLAFLFGLKGNMVIEVPRIGDSVKDKIAVGGGVWIGFDAVTWAGALKVSGTTKGDWTRPFGINDHFTLSDSAILIGVDTDGALEFGIKGGMKVTGLPSGNNIDGTAAFLININFAASGIPIPKKLAFLYKVKGDLGPLQAIEMNEAVFKGVLTGPMAKEILKALPDQKSKSALLSLQSKLRKGSLIKVMQLDKLPLPFMKIQDPEIYFATPGAKIPDTDAFDTMGLRLGGKLKMDLLGKEYHLAGADLRLTLVDGLVAKADLGNIEIPKLGGLTNVKFDMVANPLVLPPQLHLKYSGALDVLGLKQSVDVEVSKDRIKLEFERDLAGLIAMHVKANTIGDGLLKVRDFRVSIGTKTEIDAIITKEIFPKLGIPKIVSEVIKKEIPLFIHGVEFKGSLVNFLKGKGKGDGSGWELFIDHSFAGTRMPPAIARVYPVWSTTNPLELIPTIAVAKAMTVSFLDYIKDNPAKVARLPFDLMTLEDALIRISKDGASIEGKVAALGIPFSETVAKISKAGVLTLKAKNTVKIGLPLGKLGTLSESQATLDVRIDPARGHSDITLQLSTASLGFDGIIEYKLSGTPTSMQASVRSDNPCAKFSSSTELAAGDLRNFAFKVGNGSARPEDFLRLVNFTPEISLPNPADAVKCGARVLAIAGKGIALANEGAALAAAGLDNIANASFKKVKVLVGAVKDQVCKVVEITERVEIKARTKVGKFLKKKAKKAFETITKNVTKCHTPERDTKMVIAPVAAAAKKIMLAAFKSPISNEPAVPFLRYYNKRSGERRFTTDLNELGRGKDGFTYDGIAGHIFQGRAPGTVPLFKYSRKTGNIRNYAFTHNVKEFGFGAHGFNLEGVAGYIYSKKQSSTVPIYRYHENSNKNYHYTTNIKDIGTKSNSRWRFDNVQGYAVHVTAPKLPPVERSNPEILNGQKGVYVFSKPAKGTVPVYKYIARENKNALFTTDINEQGYGNPWFSYEGIAGYVHNEPVPGTRPIYRYLNARENRNAYTADAARWNGQKGKDGYKFEVILGYSVGPEFGPGKHDKITSVKSTPLLRYFNAATNDHMYTADPGQLGDGRDGYSRDGVAGSIFTKRVKGSIPLYRYWNGNQKDHIFTTNFQAFWYGKDGYEFVAVEGYVYASERAGAQGLHRYYNAGSKDSLLTTDFGEFNGRKGKGGFAHVRVEGWVPPVAAPGDTAINESSTLEPFIRYRHTKSGDHRMVRGMAELGEGRDGFEFEYVAGMIFPKKAKGTIALYRYVNSVTGDHQLTRDFAKLAFGKNNYKYLGIAGYVYPDNKSGTAELYRYSNPSTGDHLATSDFNEFGGRSGANGYKFERGLGYLPEFVPPGMETPIEKSKPVLLARYVNSASNDHLMTAGLNDLGDGGDGYDLERYHGYILQKRAQGTVPLYRYFNKNRNDTLITTNFEEHWYGKAGYSYRGVLGYIYDNKATDRVSLRRYFNRQNQDTLLTTDSNELDGTNGKNGYEYIGTLGYVPRFEAPGTTDTIVKTEPVPLVRYKSSTSADHILTAGSSEFGVKKGDVEIQRAQGRIFAKRAPETAPLYQYVDKNKGTHRYTTDFNEWLLNKGGIKYDQIVGYIYPEQRSGAVSLHRYDNDALSDTVLTVYPKEFSGAAGYKHVGIAGWVPEYIETPKPGFNNTYIATNKNFSCLESGEVVNSTLSSRLCSENINLRFSLWQDGTVRNDTKNLCIGAAETGKGAVVAGTCDYSQNQQWKTRWAAGSSPTNAIGEPVLQLVHAASGKCLGLENASGRDGLEADLYSCTKPGPNPQTWIISSERPQYLLPGTDAPVQKTEPVWLARYVNPKTKSGDHIVTAGFEEFGRGKNNYSPDVLMGKLSVSKAAPNMVPLYRYHNKQNGDHLFTTNFHERRFGQPDYEFESTIGYVYPSQQAGTVALHRYSHKGRGDNILTVDFNEWGGSSGRDGYSYIGVEGWTLNTGAAAMTSWEDVYLANTGNMVCLDRVSDENLSSTQCENRLSHRFALWSDNTIRNVKGDLCLDASMKTEDQVRVSACNDNLSQRWMVDWQGGKWPGAADGKISAQLTHWRSDQCITLEDGSGVDAVRALIGKCGVTADNDKQGTWWAHAAVPTFVPPGSDAPVTTSEPVALIRYVSAKATSGDHMLTAGPDELGLGKNGYDMQLAQGKIFSKRASGTVPLYRYNNGKSGDHLYTRDFRELGWGSKGYQYEGIAGYVYSSQQPGTVALHRYNHKSKGDHLYTSDFKELGGGGGKGGYKYEGITAWIPEYPEDPEPQFANSYVATNGNLSCLNAKATSGAVLQSSFCHDHKQGQFSLWKDGTIRQDGKNLCLSVRKPNKLGSAATLERCDYTKDQQLNLKWAISAPTGADGLSSLQIVHSKSGRCIGLNDGSGQDGVTASIHNCEKSGDNVQTWVMSKTRPEFVAPFMGAPVRESVPVPFIRYANKTRNDHLMHAGPKVFGLRKEGYEMQLAQGKIFVSRAEGTVPLYRYVDKTKGDTIYTKDFHEYRYFKASTALDGVAGYVYPAARAGSVPLHRYVNRTKGDHLIAGNPNEFGSKAGKNGYAYDGVIGWVPPYIEDPIPALQNIYMATNGNLSCLDGASKNGPKLRSSFCEGAGDLGFSFWADGTIRHDKNNLCLSARKSTNSGAKVTVERCDYTHDQQWMQKWLGGAAPSSNGKSGLNVVHAVSKQCIGLRDASGLDGVEAALFKCGNVEPDVQTWTAHKKAPVFELPGMDIAVKKTVPVPLVRYVKGPGRNGDHLMKVGPDEWGAANQGYHIERPVGTIFTRRDKQLVPLYRYVNGQNGDHLYATDFHQRRYAKDGYGYDDYVGYVYAGKVGDSVALHRYFNASSKDHVLTSNFDEFGQKGGGQGYVYQRIVGWVPPYEAEPVTPLKNVFVVGQDWMCGGEIGSPGASKFGINPCRDNNDLKMVLL